MLFCMKYIGIDYGTKRIGVAVCDESETLAFPLGIVSGGKGALEEVLELARENEVTTFVMGESRNFAGEPNPIMKEITQFAAHITEKGFVVLFEPEFMTSAAAVHQHEYTHDHHTHGKSRKEQIKDEYLDSSAAALILQSFLDRKKKKA